VRVYIAGPMTGLPDYNFPAFYAAAERWRAYGWDVINPAEAFGGVTNLPYKSYCQKDVEDLQACDAIAMLDGWDGPNARGSVWERQIAISFLRIPVYYGQDVVYPNEVPPRESILAEADRLVNGPRQADYGHPIDDFTRTGRIWGAILETEDVPPEKVALCMVGVKMSREVNRPKRDNRVDMAGYTGTLELVRDRQGTT
jgi:hypothetical protein